MASGRPLYRKPFPPSPSELTKRNWNLESTGEISCRHTDGEFLRAADALWIPRRRPGDVQNWRWTKIHPDARDIFGLMAILGETSGTPLGLWVSTASRLLDLPGGPAYRVDFLELYREVRGAEVGVFLMGLIADRALECGAKRVVLGSFPESRKLYDVTGGRQHPVKGWKVAEGLLPYEFLERELVELREAADERRS